MMSRIYTWLLALLLVLLPSNLFLKWAERVSYVNGLAVDYLLPKLYLSDGVILTILSLTAAEWLWRRWRGQAQLTRPWGGNSGWLSGCLLAGWLGLGVLQLSSERPLSAIWFWAKLVELFLFGWWLLSHRSLFTRQLVQLSLGLMVVSQFLIGVAQFIRQDSVFPSYVWFGETRLAQQFGLARGELNFQPLILPYGTTPHPNIWAGAIVLGCLIGLATLSRSGSLTARRRPRLLAAGAVSLAVAAVSLSQSWSAAASLGLGMIILLTQRWWQQWAPRTLSWGWLVVGIGVVLIPWAVQLGATADAGQLSLTRRSWLNQVAWQVWQQQPWTGVGLNHFTIILERYPSLDQRRFVQPPHHIPLLWLAEGGFLLVGLLLASAWWLWQQLAGVAGTTRQWSLPVATGWAVTVIVLPLVTLDHYGWTLQVGQLSLVILGTWLGYALRVRAPD